MKRTAQGIACTALFATSLASGLMAEGVGGLSQAIDTPKAADGIADDLTILFDYREDYRALSFGLQPSDRVEIGLSFPTYDDNDGSSSGNELSFGLRFLNESTYFPALTVGVVGIGSDDRGSGEYILASKSFGAVQVSAGLGWGRYAQEVAVDRGQDDDVFQTDHLFEGDTEPFANITWDTGIDGLTVAAEYSGIAGAQEDDTFAASLSYTLVEGFAVTGLVNNQGDAGLRLEFSANPAQPFVQTDIGRGPHPYAENSPALAGQPQPNEAQVFAVLQERLEDENIQIRRFSMRGDTIDVTAASNTDPVFARIVGRVARVLSAIAPANITTFRVTQNTGAFDSNVVVLDRAGLDDAVGKPNAAALAWDATSFEPSPLNRPAALGESEFEPRFTYGLEPTFKADFITSDTLELTGTLNANARYTFSRQTFVSGTLGYRFLNQWDQEDPPDEPGVRSDSTSYEPDIVFLKSLSLRHRFPIAPALYGRVSAGLFERAYGGVSGEVIWRDPEQNFALGLEATYVQKRAYEGWFGFEDADATTVIASLYANVGQNGNFVIVDAGQHLAEDFAVGLTVGRNYRNGWRLAASTGWSEERDSALKFGAELSIPLSWTSPDGGTGTTNLSVGGQSGDFGSRVSGTGGLYSELRASDKRRIEDGFGEFWN
ncbi:exopolysaccharide biosynthesis protein YbjH [Yoonia maricola]|uniref:Exopolysaccharide biosynthesis protein YbjH n=1 Tax=Yoonia maricola TaxID=420999 RepID=A0A2M8W1X9_9RHOB|nr:YjbH domain-containing protein [Yoonia maricola]PJI84931.1 exopolysaccharide biosynthesis protein YbjH [Yoonia maricola]